MTNDAFSGVTVLDCTTHPRGRVTARMLAQRGARVYRDGTLEEPYLDRGKIVAPSNLLAAADAFDVLLLPDGADAEAVHHANPALIVVALSAFGRTGPERHAEATDAMLQGLTGSAWLARDREGRPRLRSLRFADSVTATHATIAIGAALLARRRTGNGALLDIAAYDCMLMMDTIFFPGVLYDPERLPTLKYLDDRIIGDTTAVYRGVDRRFLIVAFGQYWSRLVKLLGSPDELMTPEFATDDGRTRKWEIIFAAVEHWLRRHGDEAALALLLDAGLPASVIYEASDALAHPQLVARVFRRHFDQVPSPGQPGNDIPDRIAALPGGTAELPLNGIRIIDFSGVTAGALATRILADLGAEVWKVEPPEGELGRTMDDLTGATPGSFMAFQSAGKKSIVVDLRSAEGTALVKTMIASAHAMVENWSAGTADRLGLGYADLSPLRPGLVMCSVSGFGQTGPFRAARSFDTVIGAASGLYSSFPSKTGGAFEPIGLSDTVTAVEAAAQLVAALYRQHRTGEGTYIDLAMLEAVAANEDGYHWRTTGSDQPHACGVVACTKDEAVVVDTKTPQSRHRIAHVVGFTGDRPSDEELVEALDALLDDQGSVRLRAMLAEAGVLSAPVRTPCEVLACAQFAVRHRTGEGLTLGQRISPFTHSFGLLRARAPELGEHHAQITEIVAVGG